MKKRKGLIVGISTLAFVGGTAFSGYQLSANAETNQSTNVQAISIQQEENISKEELQHRMLNSIDYFESVEGGFIYHDILGEDTTIDYKIKIKDKPSSYEKLIMKDNTIQASFDGTEKTFLDDKNKVFRKLGVMKQTYNKDQFKSESPKERYQSRDGEKVYIHRGDPSNMGLASESVFPQNIALGFLEDYNKWDISSEGTLNGENVVIVKGTLNDYYSAKFKATSFKLWVDKDTGILLQREVYNENGDVVEFIKTTSIKINSSIDDTKFKLKIPTDYKNYKDVAASQNKN